MAQEKNPRTAPIIRKASNPTLPVIPAAITPCRQRSRSHDPDLAQIERGPDPLSETTAAAARHQLFITVCQSASSPDFHGRAALCP
jgi:hypothetical protein